MIKDFGPRTNPRLFVPAGGLGTVEEVCDGGVTLLFDNHVHAWSDDGHYVEPAPDAPPGPDLKMRGPDVYRLPDGERIAWTEQRNGDYIVSVYTSQGKLVEVAMWQVATEGEVFKTTDPQRPYWEVNMAAHRIIFLAGREASLATAVMQAWLHPDRPMTSALLEWFGMLMKEGAKELAKLPESQLVEPIKPSEEPAS